MLDDDTKKWCNEYFSDTDVRGPWLDELLLHYCHVLNLRNKGFVESKVFASLAYEIDRCLCNKQLQDYLYNLMMYTKNKNQRDGGKSLSFSFGTLVKYGLKKGFLSKSAFSKRYEIQPWMHRFYEIWLNDEN